MYVRLDGQERAHLSVHLPLFVIDAFRVAFVDASARFNTIPSSMVSRWCRRCRGSESQGPKNNIINL